MAETSGADVNVMFCRTQITLKTGDIWRCAEKDSLLLATFANKEIIIIISNAVKKIQHKGRAQGLEK